MSKEHSPTAQARGGGPGDQERYYASGGLGATGYDPAADEIDLIDLVKVIWRSRWLIAGLTIVAALAAFAFTITQERVYEAKAVFAIQTDGRVSISGTGETPQYTIGMLTTMLRSRQLAERVMDSQDLVRRWEAEDRGAALKRLQKEMTVSADERDRVITVSFTDPDPVLARDVVNAYVEYFEDFTHDINVTAEDQALVFIEDRLREVEEQLEQAEAELRDFKAGYRITSLDEQTRLLVNAYGQTQDRIRALNVELTGKLSYLGERSPEVRELQNRLEELYRQLAVIEGGGRIVRTDLLGGQVQVGDIPLSQGFGLQEVPEIARQLTQLEREAALQREMYELLRQRHEAAKIEASRKENIMRLIDPPGVPEEPVSRRLVLNVAVAGFLGLFGSTMLAFVTEYFRSREWDEETMRELPFIALLRRGS